MKIAEVFFLFRHFRNFLSPKNTLCKFWMNFAHSTVLKNSNENSRFAYTYTNRFALIRESFTLIPECYVLIRESYAFTRESFAFIRESFAVIRECFAFFREKYNFSSTKMTSIGFRKKHREDPETINFFKKQCKTC